MTKWVEQWICIRFCIKLQKLCGWFRRLQLWATGDWQLHHNHASAHVSRLLQFFGKTSSHPGNSAPYSPDVAPCDFWLFPKLKSPLKGKRFQTINEIQENVKGQVMAMGRTVWGPKVPIVKGTEASLSYVQCFLYLVSSSVIVSIFQITWLDNIWTDLVYIQGLAQITPSFYYKIISM